jgi:WS/DGAT/MGAT family acyltransferase
MTRLHALDVAWLELETGPSIATGLVCVLEGPAPSIASLRTLVAQRLPAMPSLRWVVSGEHGLRRPEWRDAGPPDLRHHVWSRHVGRRDGDDDAVPLERFVSAVMERPLDRTRPLWEIAVGRGLPDGGWVMVWRWHHAIADGQGAQALIGELLDVSPDGTTRMADVLAAMRPNAHSDEQGMQRSRWQAARDLLEAGLKEVSAAARHLPDAARLAADLAPRPGGSLTGALSDRRVWRSGTARLSDAQQTAHRLDRSVNDVLLAAVATGFRDLLSARGEPVDSRVLRCVIPVSRRGATDGDLENKVSAAWVELPVGDMTFDERVRAVSRTTTWQKEVGTPAVAAALIALTDALVPAPLQEVVVSHGRWVPGAMADTLVTNVPGAPFPIYVAGRRVPVAYPLIPVDGHLRVIVGVVSHDGWLCIGVTGDGVHAPDVAVLRDGMVAALTPA